jgi:DNA-binding transcriptional regulator YiaG
MVNGEYTMDKRLAKRHKRQVSRAKEHVKLSEPDVRTPEEIKAAREASRANQGGKSASGNVGNATPAFRSNIQGTGSAAKTDG